MHPYGTTQGVASTKGEVCQQTEALQVSILSSKAVGYGKGYIQRQILFVAENAFARDYGERVVCFDSSFYFFVFLQEPSSFQGYGYQEGGMA